MSHLVIFILLASCRNLSTNSFQWRIPKELHQCIECLPNSQPIIPTFTHILVSKGRMCIQLKVTQTLLEFIHLFIYHRTESCFKSNYYYKIKHPKTIFLVIYCIIVIFVCIQQDFLHSFDTSENYLSSNYIL